jgi:[acyl-carrier-protein] S-malonyltransferase
VPRDLAVLFPGQGSHTSGDRDVVERLAPDLLARCVALVGEDPFPRAGESTRFAQPAILCTGLARFRASGLDAREVVAFAGHSLGELTALAAAGVLAEDDALRLVVLRGRLMGEADGGGMLALRADVDAAEELAAQSGTVVANDNCPGQVVLSGEADAVDRAQAAAKERRVRGLRLDVTGAFHSPAMAGAAAPFAEALRDVEVHAGSAPVVSCVSAQPFADVRAQLAQALTSRVRWREVLLELERLGAHRFADAGPGRVVAGLAKKTLPTATVLEDADVVLA